jgi:hypothetical protein
VKWTNNSAFFLVLLVESENSLTLTKTRFRGRINLCHSEGGGFEMLMTLLKGASLSSGRVGLTRYCSGVATYLIIG